MSYKKQVMRELGSDTEYFSSLLCGCTEVCVGWQNLWGRTEDEREDWWRHQTEKTDVRQAGRVETIDCLVCSWRELLRFSSSVC